jgi:CBS domain-containing protein
MATERKGEKAGGSRKRRGRATVGEVMIRDVITIDSGATLLEAAERMRDANVGMLPVIQDGAVSGVITDRDLVVRAMTRDVRASEAIVGDCLSTPPRCAEEDWSVDDAMQEMAAQQVGRLPVVDPSGHIIGVVTLSSLALRSPKRAEALETAQEVSRRSTRVA